MPSLEIAKTQKRLQQKDVNKEKHNTLIKGCHNLIHVKLSGSAQNAFFHHHFLCFWMSKLKHYH